MCQNAHLAARDSEQKINLKNSFHINKNVYLRGLEKNTKYLTLKK